MKIPEINSKWRHQNGCEYIVIVNANTESKREEYPVTVVYKGVNGKIWCKPLDNFLSKMTAI
jgi:hypothetical protein